MSISGIFHNFFSQFWASTCEKLYFYKKKILDPKSWLGKSLNADLVHQKEASLNLYICTDGAKQNIYSTKQLKQQL